MKTIYGILLLLLIIPIAFTSCGDDNFVMNYEQPLATLVRSAVYSDTEAYLRCFTPEAEDAYRKSEDYSKALAETLLPRKEDKKPVFNFEVKSKKDLDNEQIDDLQKEYKDKYTKNIKIKKAYKLNVEFALGEKDEKHLQRMNLTVVKIDDSWYIFSDVITKFDFK